LLVWVEAIFGDVPHFILVIEEKCSHLSALTLKQEKKVLYNK